MSTPPDPLILNEHHKRIAEAIGQLLAMQWHDDAKSAVAVASEHTSRVHVKDVAGQTGIQSILPIEGNATEPLISMEES